MSKVAVVSGGSSGIGKAVSIELCQKGYKVYAVARTLKGIDHVTKDYPGLPIIPYELDITSVEAIQKFKEFLKEELPKNEQGKPVLDVLYNNAGQSCTFPALDVTPEAMEQCFRVNVFGHINVSRELSEFVINGKGTILFTGSLAGIISFPFGSIYSATKAAIHAYARGLHLELQPFGVRVINVITGGVATNISDDRPLPEGSIYDFKEGREAFDYRQNMVSHNVPMSATEYAKQMVTLIVDRKKDPVDVYRGSQAWMVGWIAFLVPYCILEWGLKRKFKLLKLFEALKKKDQKME
ncbi:NADPH-dependent 1-acyldihydroxyacetone phosphate reductase [Monosporozyma unispora]|nr:NADPH-dependent 1-acyl dihydroxyacetone phosphate reductase [Kazachstania unispora]